MAKSRVFVIAVHGDLDTWKDWSPDPAVFRAVRVQEEDGRGQLKGVVHMLKQTTVPGVEKHLPGKALVKSTANTDAINDYVFSENSEGIRVNFGRVLNATVRSMAGKLACKRGLPYDEVVKRLPEAKRNKVDVVHKLMNGANLLALTKDHPDILTMHLGTMKANARELKSDMKKECMKQKAEKVVLRPWQRELEKELNQPADPRKIIVYVDKEGNSGKTFYAQNRVQRYPDKTIVMNNGKSENMLHVASKVEEDPDVIFIDLSKCMSTRVNYDTIEALKNGMFCSQKYNGRMVFWEKRPHFVIFSNCELDWSQMVSDRWIKRHLVRSNDSILTV